VLLDAESNCGKSTVHSSFHSAATNAALARRHQPTLATAGQSGYEPATPGKARGNCSAICKIQGDFETKTQIGESGFGPHGVLLVQMDDCCVFATAIDEDNIGYR